MGQIAKRAAIYARISLDRDGAGLGVDRQREDCLALATERGWNVVAEFSDNDVSAFSGRNRPGYRSLLELLKSGGCDVVLAWHVDRLHRSPIELEEYISICEVASAATVTVRAGELDLSTAAGRMVARMLGAAARHESEQKSERVRRKRRQEAEAGRAHGQLGYGYDHEQKVVPAEATVIVEVAERLLAGETLYGLAVDLNARGVPTPGAGQWHHRQVLTILSDADLERRVERKMTPIEVTPDVKRIVKSLSGGVPLSEDEARGLTSKVLSSAADVTKQRRAELAGELVRPGARHAGQVAKVLTHAGVQAPRTMWRAANLRTMIRRGSLCGWRDFEPGGRGGGQMVAKGDWEPILSKDTALRLRALLDAPERRRRGREHKNLLSSIVVCGNCGAPLGGHESKTEGRRYQCSSQPGLRRCGRLSIVADPVDQLVEAAVLSALADVRLRARVGREARGIGAADAEHELLQIRELRDLYAKDAADGSISRAEWFALREGLAERETSVRSRMATGQAAEQRLQLVPIEPLGIRRWWEAADLRAKRQVIMALVEKVVIKPAKPGGRFDPSRVGEPIWKA